MITHCIYQVISACMWGPDTPIIYRWTRVADMERHRRRISSKVHKIPPAKYSSKLITFSAALRTSWRCDKQATETRNEIRRDCAKEWASLRRDRRPGIQPP